ncbi:hypothetical protein EON65_57355, partial [archaeon]
MYSKGNCYYAMKELQNINQLPYNGNLGTPTLGPPALPVLTALPLLPAVLVAKVAYDTPVLEEYWLCVSMGRGRG